MYNLTTVCETTIITRVKKVVILEHYPMTGDESGDLALALGLFAFLFTVGLCIILRRVPHFVWKRLTASKESLLAYADAVSSPRKLKKSPSLMDSGVTALARSLTLNRRLRVNISEAVHAARYVTHHP